MRLFTHLFFIGFMAWISVVSGEITDSATWVSFPSEVSFSFDGKEYKLKATGVATRKKFFATVYSVAHYAEEKKEGPRLSLAEAPVANVAKQLSITWLRDVSAQKVKTGYQDAFKNAVSRPVHSQIQGQIQQFLSFFKSNIKEGDQTVLRWIPDGHVEVFMNGNLAGEIVNKEFAQGLWNIWFGSKSVVNRNQLMAG